MLKRIILVAGFLAIISKLEAYWVSAKNNTDAPILLEVNGLGWGDSVIVQPGKEEGVQSGGICPWFAKISDGKGLSNAPMAVELHYGTGEHCFGKRLEVTRVDKLADAPSNVNVLTTGGSVNLAPQAVIWRKFVVKTDKWAQSGHNSGDYKYIIESYVPGR